MYTLNIRAKNTLGQIKPIYYLYKNSLNNIKKINIDYIIIKKIYIESGLSKQGIWIIQSHILQYILQLFRDFG